MTKKAEWLAFLNLKPRTRSMCDPGQNLTVCVSSICFKCVVGTCAQQIFTSQCVLRPETGRWVLSEKPEHRLFKNRITGGAVKKPAEYEIWNKKAGGAG